MIGASAVPYYSQWESPDLVPQFLDGSMASAADPRWAASGARTPAEYGFWAPRVCGLACLRMILSSRAAPVLILTPQGCWKCSQQPMRL